LHAFLQTCIFFKYLFQYCFLINFWHSYFSYSLDWKELNRSSLLEKDWKQMTKVKLLFNFTLAPIYWFRMQKFFSFRYVNLFRWLSTKERRLALQSDEYNFLNFICYDFYYTNYLSFNCRYYCRTRAGVCFFIVLHVYLFLTRQ